MKRKQREYYSIPMPAVALILITSLLAAEISSKPIPLYGATDLEYITLTDPELKYKTGGRDANYWYLSGNGDGGEELHFVANIADSDAQQLLRAGAAEYLVGFQYYESAPAWAVRKRKFARVIKSGGIEVRGGLSRTNEKSSRFRTSLVYYILAISFAYVLVDGLRRFANFLRLRG